MIYIVSTDRLLAEALEVILNEHGMTDIFLSEALPNEADLVIADADTVDMPADRKGILTISADKKKGAYLMRPFFEDDFAMAVSSMLPQSDLYKATPRLTKQGVNYKGKNISLSPIEYKIFKILYSNMGRCVTISELLTLFENKNDSGIVPVYIRFLRKKLDFAFGERLIYTVRGRGYMLKFP